MLERAVTAGLPAGWVTADTIYGGDRRLRIWLEEQAIAYVLAARAYRTIVDLDQPRPWPRTRRAAAHRGPGRAVAPHQCRTGTKGKRLYDWTRVPLIRYGWPSNVGFWLLARRSIEDPKDLAFYACFGPASTPLVDLVRVAGVRWAVEETFQQAKGEVGLDHDQVRCWTAWYRHITLALLAHAFLAVVRTQATTVNGDGQRGQSW